MTQNWSVAIALLLWPIVGLWLYQSRPIGQATLWTILGGYLLLPAGGSIKFEMIPAFDKSILPWSYLEITGKDPQVFYAVLMMASGVLMVVLIEKIAARLKTKS